MSFGAKPKIKRLVHVPSRYKQHSEKLSSRENSCLEKNSKEISGNSSQDISSISKLGSQSSQGLTSTPTSGGESFPQFDASAVTDSKGHLNIPLLKERIVPMPVDSGKRNLMKHKALDETIVHGPVSVLHEDKKRSDSQFEVLASAELDLLYATYLQSAFLASEAQKALEAKTAAAVETLYKLSTLVQQHLQKAKSQQTLLKMLSILIEVHNHCQKQEEMLKPVFEIIPSLDEQYKSLTEAINANKHKLPVNDVILPGDDFDIQNILQKMSEFISAFFETFPSYKDDISASHVLKKYVDLGELLTETLKRGVTLLTEADNLYFAEASLSCENL